MFLHILVNQVNRKTSTIKYNQNKVAGGSVSLENVLLKLFTENPSSSVVNWDSFGARAVFGGQEKWMCNSACPGKRGKCNCAYPQKVKVHEQIVQGSCHFCMFSIRSAPGVAKKGNHGTLPGNLLSQHQYLLPNLHINSAFTVPCWLRHWPQVCVNHSPKIKTCSCCSWRGADLEPFLWFFSFFFIFFSIPAQVAVGEELTWSYTNVLQPQAATLSKHLDTWMFKCTCPRWKTKSTEAVLTKKLTNSHFKAKKWKTYRILVD